MKSGRLICTLCLALLATGCSIRPPALPGGGDGAPTQRLDPERIADAVPRTEPRSKRGNPASYVVRGHRYYTLTSSRGYVERGIASWYGTKFHGRSTSSGEPYDMYAMTAAHKSLPLPTYVQVTNLRNGRSAVVKVNDRGPFHDNRLIDLSYAAATKLGILAQGTGLVEVRAIDPATPLRQASLPTDGIPAPPAALTTPAVAPGLFVQVGAFSNRLNADRLQQRLARALGEQIRIQQANHQGQAIFRVQIGPLAGVDQVDSLTLNLPRLGILETQVVID